MTDDEMIAMYMKEGENYGTVAREAGLPIHEVIRRLTMLNVNKPGPSWWDAERQERARRKRMEEYNSQGITEEDD